MLASQRGPTTRPRRETLCWRSTSPSTSGVVERFRPPFSHPPAALLIDDEESYEESDSEKEADDAAMPTNRVALALAAWPVHILYGTDLRSSDGFVSPLAFLKKDPSTATGKRMSFACRFVLPATPLLKNFVQCNIQVNATTKIAIKVRRDSNMCMDTLCTVPPKGAIFLLRDVVRSQISSTKPCLSYDEQSSLFAIPTMHGCSLECVFAFNNAMDADYRAVVSATAPDVASAST
ncbi:hypothetical protein [Sporisorium scitamineum]|nr:hypothetical protein [Sporisorium scitamineum]